MKKSFAALVLLLLVLGVAPCSIAKPTQPSKPEKKTGLHEELIAQEKAVWESYKRQDAKALKELLAEDFYAIEDADGEIMTKAEALENLAGLKLKNYEMRNIAVIEINEGSAIVRYKVQIEGSFHNHAFEPRWSMVSSVWTKRSGKWQNLMYQETKIGE